MSTILSSTAEDAVAILQSRVERATPGSDEEQIAETALDYVLGRPIKGGAVQFLVRDCERNARYSYYRSRQRGRSAVAQFARCTYGPTLVQRGEEIDVVQQASLEEQSLAETSELCTLAQEQAAVLGPQGPRFVRRLMAGDTLTEAAKAVGISRATAYRWRDTLADLLAPHRYLAEVAA